MQPYTKQFYPEPRPLYYDSVPFLPSHFEANKKQPRVEEFVPSSEDFPSLSQSRATYLKDSVKRLERTSKPNPNAASFVPGNFAPPPPVAAQSKPRCPDSRMLQEGIYLAQLELPDRNASGLIESPFTGRPTSDPEYRLPECFVQSSVPLKASHLQKFSLSSLFYIFYCMPGQLLQTVAAEDLYRREWQFHPASAVWYRVKNSERQVFCLQSWTVEKAAQVPENLLSRDEFRSQRVR